MGVGVGPAGFTAGTFVWGTIDVTAGAKELPKAEPSPVGPSIAFERLRLITCIHPASRGVAADTAVFFWSVTGAK